jgi:hypothetical protein
MPSDRITVRVPNQLADDLQRFVVMSGKAESTIIREALAEYLEAHGQLPNCFDLLVKSKFLGSIQGLPPDLSSNQSHMDGFGSE